MKKLCVLALTTVFVCLVVTAYAKSPASPAAAPSSKAPTNSIVIKVQVIPNLAAAGTNSSPWQVQVDLFQENNGGGEHASISNKICVANDKGQVTFKLPLQKTHAYLMTYRVTCLGGWAYNDESSPYLMAGEPQEYNITLSMTKRQ